MEKSVQIAYWQPDTAGPTLGGYPSHAAQINPPTSVSSGSWYDITCSFNGQTAKARVTPQTKLAVSSSSGITWTYVHLVNITTDKVIGVSQSTAPSAWAYTWASGALTNRVAGTSTNETFRRPGRAHANSGMYVGQLIAMSGS